MSDTNSNQTEHDRGSLAERTPFFVRDNELEVWIKEHFHVKSQTDVESLRLALKRKGDELRQRFEQDGWKFED